MSIDWGTSNQHMINSLNRKNKIKIVVSRKLSDYKEILEELVDEFGYEYYPSILAWCNVIKDDSHPSLYWDLYLIKYDDKPVGICGFYTQYANTLEEMWLAYFGVIPKYRNKKIGAFAIEWMKEQAKNVGCESLKAYMDNDKKKSPLKFYQRHGFKILGTVRKYIKDNPQLDMDFFDSPKHFIIECKL
jgi:GNAT superfamily N-acetyltransferase